jgi:hypothetical protein
MKSKCKSNILLKRLLSSLWGSIVRTKKYYFNADEYDELDVSRDDTSEYKWIDETLFRFNGKDVLRVECIKTSEPYRTNLARLKCFMLSLSRNIIGELIINNNIIDKVMRVHTDGLCLTEEYNFTEEYSPKLEDKTTGIILWENVNRYYKVHYCQQYEDDV